MNMRKIGRQMSICMGVTMSLVLSLVGTVVGGHFTILSWGISFAISLVISLILGFLVPMKRVSDAACNACKINPQSLPGNLFSALISDLIYTPLITIVMVVIMVGNARKQLEAMGVPMETWPKIGQALVPSLIICFIVGYIVIAIVQPLFLKLIMNKNK